MWTHIDAIPCVTVCLSCEQQDIDQSNSILCLPLQIIFGTDCHTGKKKLKVALIHSTINIMQNNTRHWVDFVTKNMEMTNI